MLSSGDDRSTALERLLSGLARRSLSLIRRELPCPAMVLHEAGLLEHHEQPVHLALVRDAFL